MIHLLKFFSSYLDAPDVYHVPQEGEGTCGSYWSSLHRIPPRDSQSFPATTYSGTRTPRQLQRLHCRAAPGVRDEQPEDCEHDAGGQHRQPGPTVTQPDEVQELARKLQEANLNPASNQRPSIPGTTPVDVLRGNPALGSAADQLLAQVY